MTLLARGAAAACAVALTAALLAQFPHGLANGNVGKCVMVHSNDAVWGTLDEEIRCYEGRPAMALTEHWNYSDEGKDIYAATSSAVRVRCRATGRRASHVHVAHGA